MDQENLQFKVQKWELLWPSGKTERIGGWGNVVESHKAGRRTWTVVLGSRGPCKVCWSLRTCQKLYREKKFVIHAGVGRPG